MIVLLAQLLLILVASKPKLTLGAGGFGFGCGSNSPAAQVPYSYVRLGPDTTPLNKKTYFQFQHFGGYSDADHAVKAFSHMHLVGAGVIDMGIFGVLPLSVDRKKGQEFTIPNDEQIRFNKSSEQAQPGYYGVNLTNGVGVELTTTQRTGTHRYHFRGKGPYKLNIMTGYLLQKKAERSSSTMKCGERCLEGWVLVKGGFGGRFGGYRVHFHLEWKGDGNQTVKLYNDTHIDGSMVSSSGKMTGAVVQVNSKTIQLFIGISYVSIANAKLNLYAETNNISKSFDQIRHQSKDTWNRELDRFQIVAINEYYQTQIDTALYRTFLTPTLFNDYNRQYPSFKNDGSVSTVPSDMGAVYTDMSLWDVHRTQMPWQLFQDLQRFTDIAKSIVLINREGGYMPKWPFAMGWTGCMIGSHANTVLADWMVKQAIRKNLHNSSEVLEYMLRNANIRTPHDSRPSVEIYPKQGYLSYQDSHRAGCSQTLELSFNDFGISEVARLLNKSEIHLDFLNRSKFYKNVWNKKTQFFDPRFKNGSFMSLSKKERVNINSAYYVQGDAWHYRFAVPHDAAGLIELFGGEKNFVKELYKFFKRSEYWPTLVILNPYYWAGNEHNLFSVWMFSFANRPDLTQRFSRMVLDTQYGVEGNGLPGNDDYATMSAWLLFASLGFYPLPSTNTYILGSPTIKYASIVRRDQRGKPKPFHIRVSGNNIQQYEVGAVSIDGKQIRDFLDYRDMDKSNSLLSFSMLRP